MFDSLITKVFSILSVQLLITFLVTFGMVAYYRYMYRKGVHGISATLNEKGELDLDIDYDKIRPLHWTSIILFIGLFIVLICVQDNLSLAIMVFCLWSVASGIMVGLSLMAVDENLGARALAITLSITLITAITGIKSGVNFSFMGNFLMVALILLLFANIIRLIFKFDGFKTKVYSVFGIIVFTFYLIYDFNKIKLNENSWNSALKISIDLYLDILNLFLHILQAMGHGHHH